MKRYPFPALLICSAMLFAVPLASAPMSGCALVQSSDDAIVNYDRANEVYIGLLNIAISARVADKIAADKWAAEYLPIINEGDRLLDDLEAAAMLQDASGADRILSLLASINARLNRILIADGVEVE